ncbi:MAG: glycosyl transferase family 2, partial [Alphaproteobacteria bacterium]|nr:glycosyl transferase family 2 [Alphaproteobacteria bacterium]
PPLDPAGRTRIRLAIVSAFYKDHSVWKIPLKGFVYGLDRRRFELVHFNLAGNDNPVSLELRQLGDKVVTGAGGLAQWLQQLRAAEPDAVFFPEFGMDGMTAMIAAVRSAPVQMSSWGHPDSCGLPSMDYFLSSALMEPPDGDEHYTERLVRLPGTSLAYDPPQRVYSSLGRADFGLERDDVVYWFGHQIKKPLPRHDSLFPRIAREVPESRFVFLNWAAEPLMARFRTRMDRAFGEYGLDYRRHCRFLDRLPPHAFDALLRASDIFLDCPDWHGCNSTLEALAVGLPVITCPGRFMRARHSAAILTRLGLTAAIAADTDGLVRLAIRLGRDPALRQALGDHIRRIVWRLYWDRAPVEALQDFLIEATAQRASTP